MKKPFTNVEIVTLAVYLLGGESRYINTEDIAIKVNELAPGRFTWQKYQGQINIENVRKRLSDAMKLEQGGYILGSTKRGWLLTETGLTFSKRKVKDFKGIDLSVSPMNTKEMLWQNREKTRMLSSKAFEKLSTNNSETVTAQEAEAFFRVDDYVTGKTRERKLDRIIKAFGDDPDLGHAVKLLAMKVRKK
jgi:hypothetical protein